MHLLDVNVLVAAYRADHPNHPVARPWFDDLLAGGGSFGSPWSCWASFVRLCTHRRVFTVPSTVDEALAFTRAVTNQPGYVGTEPGPRHLELLARHCGEGGATGDLVSDAAIAAVAAEHGAVVASFDRDFVRFPGVRLVRPGDGASR